MASKMDGVTLLSVLIVLTISIFLMLSNPKPKNKIYSQPNKWYSVKYTLFQFILWLRKRQKHKEVGGDNAGIGRKSRNTPEDMDKIQELDPAAPKAVDAVYLTGSNSEGQFLVTATARRHNNHIQTLLFLRVPEIGFMVLPCMPDTSLLGTKKNEYAAGGLHIRVVEPMKKWNIKFEGKLRLLATGKLLDVNFDLDWIACTKFYDFDTDLHPNVTCDAIARETWSREFFNKLKSLHQTHYEQFGDTRGTVIVKGYDPIKFDVRGVRDHSYGKVRNWDQLHRYCIQYASFPDGTCLCVSAISMPTTMSRLHCGYYFHPSGEMEPMSWCDLELYELGDCGTPMDNFTVRFKIGKVIHKIDVTVLDFTSFYIGDAKRDAKIYERYCKYILDDKLEGYGLSEWEYRNTDGSLPENKPAPGIQYYKH